jgi:predicted nucleotidyltransferase
MPSGCTTRQLAHHSQRSLIIIPFGKLETAERTIAWPPDADVVMNVAAFSDVFENSLRVQVCPDLIIPAASLHGLIVLKLFAWLDRHEGRDVQDSRPSAMPAVVTAERGVTMRGWPTAQMISGM